MQTSLYPHGVCPRVIGLLHRAKTRKRVVVTAATQPDTKGKMDAASEWIQANTDAVRILTRIRYVVQHKNIYQELLGD